MLQTQCTMLTATSHNLAHAVERPALPKQYLHTSLLTAAHLRLPNITEASLRIPFDQLYEFYAA